jgi:serine/threonine protein kinase
LKSKGYCHSDIKPANTTLIPVTHKKELYTVKVIDFGTATCNTTIPERDYTPEYFLNPAM